MLWDRSDAALVVVHRPRYGDWSFPKGKCERGEDDATCACREVKEETGYDCALLAEIGRSRYVDRQGRSKVVTYFLMERLRGEFLPNDEVDLVMTVPFEELDEVLTYPEDLALARRVPDALAHLTSAGTDQAGSLRSPHG